MSKVYQDLQDILNAAKTEREAAQKTAAETNTTCSAPPTASRLAGENLRKLAAEARDTVDIPVSTHDLVAYMRSLL